MVFYCCGYQTIQDTNTIWEDDCNYADFNDGNKSNSRAKGINLSGTASLVCCLLRCVLWPSSWMVEAQRSIVWPRKLRTYHLLCLWTHLHHAPRSFQAREWRMERLGRIQAILWSTWTIPELGDIKHGGKELFAKQKTIFIERVRFVMDEHIFSKWQTSELIPLSIGGNKPLVKHFLRWLVLDDRYHFQPWLLNWNISTLEAMLLKQ